MGGYTEDGDCYDTQLSYFEEQLQDFWNELTGPYETIRQQLLQRLYSLQDEWKKVIILENGTL